MKSTWLSAIYLALSQSKGQVNTTSRKMLPIVTNMKNGNAKKNGSIPENEAAICVAATGKMTAVANGRLAYESVWHQQMQPWAWDHAHPVGDVPKGYVNPIPWVGVVKPADWDRMKDNPDSVDGKPPVPVNEMRIRHPNAVFMAPRRLQMYKDAVLAAAEPKYLVLWAINIDGERWLEAEDLMVQDPYWWKVYQNEFGFSGEEAPEAIGITGHHGTGETSGTGTAPAEA